MRNYFGRLACCGLLFFAIAQFLAPLPPLQAQQNNQAFQDADQQYEYAVGLVKRKYYDLAAEQFLIFIRSRGDSPRLPQAFRHLIECYQKLGYTSQLENTVQEFQRRWPDSPDTPKLALISAECAYDRQDYTAAARMYGDYVDTPDEATAECARYFLAQCKIKQNDIRGAKILLLELADKQFSKSYPHRVYAAYSLANVYLGEYTPEKALPYLKKLESSQLTPDDIHREITYLLGNIALNSGDYPIALGYYEKYLTNYAESPHANAVRISRLKAVYNMQDFKRSLKLADELLKRLPNEGDRLEIYAIQAGSFMGLKHFNQAQDLYRKVIDSELTPEYLRKHCTTRMVYCLAATEKYHEILDLTSDFLQNYPNSAEKGDMLLQRGIAFKKLQQPQDAIPPLTDAMTFFLGEPKRQFLVGRSLADCYQEIGDNAGAILVLKKRLPCAPPNELPNCYQEIIQLEFQNEDYPTALQDCETAIATFTNDTSKYTLFLDWKIQILLKTEKYQEARQVLWQQLDLLAGDKLHQAAFLLVQIDLKLQNELQATTDLEKVLDQVTAWNDLRARKNLCLLVQLEMRNSLNTQAVKHLLITSNWQDQEILDAFSPANLLDDATLLVEKNRYLLGERFLRLAMTSSDQQIKDSASIVLAEMLVKLQRYQDAIQVLQPFLGLNENNIPEMAKITKYPAHASLLAEILLNDGNTKLAQVILDKILEQPPRNTPRALARTQYLKAKILVDFEDAPKEALPLCLKNYVLLDDEIYSPLSMLLARDIFLKQGNQKDADQVTTELKNRFPNALPK